MNVLTLDKTKCKGISTLGTRVYLNGEELHGVTSTMINIDVNDAPRFSIELIGDVEIINKP